MNGFYNIFNSIPSHLLTDALLPLPKQDIFNASEVNHHWHSILSDPKFIRRWLKSNGVNLPPKIRDIAVRHFLKNRLFSNVGEIQPLIEKIISKNAPIHIGVYFHDVKAENSFQIHENTMLFPNFEPGNASHFLILPLNSMPQQGVVSVTYRNRDWDGRLFMFTTHGDEEVAKVRTATLQRLGI